MFDADEKANALGAEALKGLIAQVAGADKGVAAKIAGTFNALVKLGNFDRDREKDDDQNQDETEDRHDSDEEVDEPIDERKVTKRRSEGLRHEFHYNIQVHLPANGSEETYLRIFNAIRKTFK